MENVRALYSNATIRVALWFCLIILTLIVVTLIFKPLLVPLLISFSLYALFEPVYALLIRRGLGEAVSAMTLIILIFSCFAVAFKVLAAPVNFQFQLLLERFPAILSSLEYSTIAFFDRFNISIDKEMISSYIGNIQLQAGELAFLYGSNFIIGLSSTMLLVPLISFYLFKDYRKFRSWLLSRLPNSSFELGCIMYFRVVRKLQIYIRGIIVQSAGVAVICSSGFFIIGFDSYILLGVFAGIFNIIPYVGPVLAMVLPVLIVLSEVPLDTFMIFMAVGVILSAQLIDNIFIIPMVIASSVNLHPLIVILGLIIFGNAFGLLGMVLAVPVMSTANIIYSRLHGGLYQRVE